jgi:hypothetical protein
MNKKQYKLKYDIKKDLIHINLNTVLFSITFDSKAKDISAIIKIKKNEDPITILDNQLIKKEIYGMMQNIKNGKLPK